MLLSILISLTLTLIIILLPKNWVTDLDDLTGVQKFHHQPTPRIAGVPVFMSFFIGLWCNPPISKASLLRYFCKEEGDILSVVSMNSSYDGDSFV